MGAFLSYSIVSGLVMFAMYLVYRLTMAGDNQHAYNRGVLLSIYLFSFLAVPVSALLRDALSGPEVAAVTPDKTDITGSMLNEAMQPIIDTDAGAPLWGTLLVWIFMAGMTVMLIKTAITWVRILSVISKGEKSRHGGYTLVLTDDASVAPFSWYRYMVMNREDYAVAGEAITLHEARHIGCRHWIDLLVAQAVTIVNWFNPAAWLMRDALMLVHEYQADNAVIDNNINPKEYQMLLIKKAVGAKFPSLANSLNHSKLKKRITMMYKSKSGTRARFKVLALAPAAVAAILVAGISPVKAAISTIETSEVVLHKGSNNNADGEIAKVIFTHKIVNHHDNMTNVVLKLTVPGGSLSVSDAKLKVASGTYTSTGMSTQMQNREARIEATFPLVPDSDFDDNSSISLSVNGSEVTLPLSSHDIALNNDTATGNIIQEIYIDGKKATQEELMAINPEEIESMTIEKDRSAIYITLKK